MCQGLKSNVLSIGTWIVLATMYVPTSYVAHWFEFLDHLNDFDFRTYCVYPNIVVVFVTLIMATVIFRKK